MNRAWRSRRAKRALREGAQDRKHIGSLRLSDLARLGYEARMTPRAQP